MRKIIYRNIQPIYQMSHIVRIFNIKTNKEIFYNPSTYKVTLETTNLKKSYPDITNLYAVTFLGSRSRKNKYIAYEFYNHPKDNLK